MAHTSHEGAHEAHGEKHYIKIWGILMVLLVISIFGPFVGDATGIFFITLLTAFGVAFVKAYMVAKYFMHLDIEKPIVWYALISCLAFMVLFFAAISPDVMNHEGSRWVNVAAKAEVERRMAEGEKGAEHGDHGAAGGDHAAPSGEHGGTPAPAGGQP
jgi:caa(3)-type oxidase subunit IV